MHNTGPCRLNHRLETHGGVTSPIKTIYNIFANVSIFYLIQTNRVKQINPRFSFVQDAETPCEEAEVIVTHEELCLFNIQRYIYIKKQINHTQ